LTSMTHSLCFILLTVSLFNIVTGNNKETREIAQAYLNAKVVKTLDDAILLATLIQKEFPNYVKSKDLNHTSIPFPCELTGRTIPRPTDARKLLPGDIDVVGAIGDSLVAAFGALSRTIIGISTEYRGHSFCGGAQNPLETFGTVPAILKKYNPNIRGFATGNGNAQSANAVLNVAVSGARSYNLLDQIEVLNTKMQNMGVGPSEWKLITVFAGGNDLCDYCEDKEKNSPANFQSNMEDTLDVLKARFRNVFINVVSPPDITLLGKVADGLCGILHDFECSCTKDSETSQAHKEYIIKLAELVALPKYRDRQDFHVALQPFLAELELPMKDGKPDKSYFAPDCFHFSGKAHEAAAVALWNNMCELPGDKKKNWVPGEPVECPEKYLS